MDGLRRIGCSNNSFEWFPGMKLGIAGAGKDGRAFAEYVKEKGAGVLAFYDEDDSKAGKTIDGIPVKRMVKEEFYQDEIYIICIGELTYLSDEELKQHKITRLLMSVTDKVYVLDKSIQIFEYLRKKLGGEFFKSDILYFPQVRIPNFLNYEKGVSNTFLETMADILLPAQYGDYSLIDEGPYEYQNVKIP